MFKLLKIMKNVFLSGINILMKIKPKVRNAATYFLPILIALVFLAFTYSLFPFREKLQFNPDEGMNLMRSMLVVKGYPLYSEISSDQPPLFTHLLAILFRVVGFEVTPARFLVLLFSTLMVWACAQFLQLAWGSWAAIFILPLIIELPQYLVLSVSTMIGLPSIALAMVALVLIVFWQRSQKSYWLVLSGFVFTLSLFIKLFTGFLIPIFLVGLTIPVYLESRRTGLSWKMLRPALIWGLACAGLGLVLGLILVGPQNIGQLISPHIAAKNSILSEEGSTSINGHLILAIPILILGCLGVLFTVFRKNWLSFYLIAWAGLAYLSLSFYAPVWIHHQLLLTVPVAMLAAAVVGEGMHALTRIRRLADFLSLRTALGVALLIGFGLVTKNYIPVLDQQLMDSPRISGFLTTVQPWKMKIFEGMNKYVDRTNWIVTDMPIYAFLVNRPVPPILGTFSLKRLSTGSLTNSDIMQAMQKYQPEQVLMGRFQIPELDAYLKDHYTRISHTDRLRLYIRNDLNPTP